MTHQLILTEEEVLALRDSVSEAWVECNARAKKAIRRGVRPNATLRRLEVLRALLENLKDMAARPTQETR